MRLDDLLHSARAVVADRTRAALTLLGIIIGTGSIVLLASLLAGGEEALLRAGQQAVEADLIQVYPAEVSVDDRRRTRRDLSRDDARALAAPAQRPLRPRVDQRGQAQVLPVHRDLQPRRGVARARPAEGQRGPPRPDASSLPPCCR